MTSWPIDFFSVSWGAQTHTFRICSGCCLQGHYYLLSYHQRVNSHLDSCPVFWLAFKFSSRSKESWWQNWSIRGGSQDKLEKRRKWRKPQWWLDGGPPRGTVPVEISKTGWLGSVACEHRCYWKVEAVAMVWWKQCEVLTNELCRMQFLCQIYGYVGK